jgi:hypothetical protein
MQPGMMDLCKEQSFRCEYGSSKKDATEGGAGGRRLAWSMWCPVEELLRL